VFSLNVNGIGDDIKRQAVFDKLKRKGSGIYLLQETHYTLIKQNKFKNQWGCPNIIFSHGSSASRGVAILFSKDLEYKIEKEFTDSDGRFIIIDISIGQKVYTIVNMYAPTRNFCKEQLSVFRQLLEHLSSFCLENVIIGGDFNLYLNPRLDKLDCMPDSNDNPEYRENILSFLETHDMIDLWRIIHPYKRVFTWHRGDKKSRLDYFFTSEHLLQ
jgi:exonuclease III